MAGIENDIQCLVQSVRPDLGRNPLALHPDARTFADALGYTDRHFMERLALSGLDGPGAEPLVGMCAASELYEAGLLENVCNGLAFSPLTAAVLADGACEGRLRRVLDTYVELLPDAIDDETVVMRVSLALRLYEDNIEPAWCLAALWRGLTQHMPDPPPPCMGQVAQRLLFDQALMTEVWAAAQEYLRHGRAAPEPANPADGHPMRILVFDDNPVNLVVSLGLLRMLGHDARGVANESDAVAELPGFTPDVLIISVDAAGMGLAERLRRGALGPAHAELPIIGLTAYRTPAALSRAWEAGIQDVLREPVQVHDLLAGLERATGRSPAGRRPKAFRVPAPDFHLDAALAGLDHDADLFAEVARAYLEHAHDQFHAVKSAAESRDSGALARAAHRLRGSLSIFSAGAAGRAASALEAAAKSGALDRTAHALAVLKQETERVDSALRRYLAQRDGTKAP